MGKKQNAQRVANTGRIEKADADDDEDEDEGEEGGEDEPGEKPAFMKKSTIAIDDLEKGLAELEEAARPTPSRRNELLEKAKVDRLSRTERNELDALMDGNRLSERISSDDTLAKGMDVSPALDVLATNVSESVDALSELIEKSMTIGDERFAALSQTMSAVGEVLRAVIEDNEELRKSLEDVLDGPARAPRAQERPITKGIERPVNAPEGAPEQQRLGKRQLVRVLEMMHQDSINKSMHGQTRTGLPIRSEMALVMAGQELSPAMKAEVEAFITQAGIAPAPQN